MKTHGYGMRVLHKQHDRRSPLILNRQPFLSRLLHQFLIKLYEKKRLILYRREQVMFSNEFEDVRSAEAQEVRKGFAGLTIGGVSI